MKKDNELNDINITDEEKELNYKDNKNTKKTINKNNYKNSKNKIKNLSFISSEFHSSYSSLELKLNKNKTKRNNLSSPKFSTDSDKISSVIHKKSNSENDSLKSNILKKNYDKKVTYKLKTKTNDSNSKSSQNENRHINVIRKFHNIYTKLTGKTFIVQSDYCLKTEKEFYDKKKNLEIVILLITILLLINGIFYYEITFSNEEEKYNNNNIILLYNLHVLNILFLLSLYFKEKIDIQYEISQGFVIKDENIFNSKRYIKLIIKFLFFLWHPSPIFAGKTIQIENLEKETQFPYPFNSILLIALLLRFYYYIIKILLINSFFMNPETEFDCRQYDFNISLMFTLKCQIKYSSMKTYSYVMLLFLIVSAYVLRIFERPVNDILDNYIDAIWLIIVTMTTVGYGDISPRTIGGRIVCIISCLIGVFLIGMIIDSFSALLYLKPHERRILSILSKAENIERKKKLASDVISQYIRILKTKVKDHNYNKIMNTYDIVNPLKKTIKQFNKEVGKEITTNTEEFLTINNRLGFFIEFQKQLSNKRKKIYEKLYKLLERIKKMKDEKIL